MAPKDSSDSIGQRGEALFFVLITKFYGRNRSLFKPQFLGDKWPTVDFIVELATNPGEVIPYFFAQVKTTRAGYTKLTNRLKVKVTAADAQRLALFPAPTYIVGIDEVEEKAYITSANEVHHRGINTLSTKHAIGKVTQDMLYEEVTTHWRLRSKDKLTSQFLDPLWS